MLACLVGSGQKQGTNSFLQWQLLNPSSVSRLCTVKCISLPKFCPMSSHEYGRSKGGAWGPQAPLILAPQSQGTEIIVCQNDFLRGGGRGVLSLYLAGSPYLKVWICHKCSTQVIN